MDGGRGMLIVWSGGSVPWGESALLPMYTSVTGGSFTLSNRVLSYNLNGLGASFRAVPDDGTVMIGIVDSWWGYDLGPHIESVRFIYPEGSGGGGTQNPSFNVTATGITGADGSINIGNIEQGNTVSINAGIRTDDFAGWTGGVTFANANSAVTTFPMPGNAVAVTANWGVLPRTLTINPALQPERGSAVRTAPAGDDDIMPGTDVIVTATAERRLQVLKLDYRRYYRPQRHRQPP
jgi:hypothetical protein